MLLRRLQIHNHSNSLARDDCSSYGAGVLCTVCTVACTCVLFCTSRLYRLTHLDPRETPRYLGGQRNSQGLNLKRGAERGLVDCENMSLEKIQSVQHCDASFKFDNF